MVKCPWCGDEVTTEEYVKHYDVCPAKGSQKEKSPTIDGKFCRYCGAPYPHHKPDCPRYIPPPLIVRDIETGKPVLAMPSSVRKATWEEIRMDSLKMAMNVAYNTFVESPPRTLHPENIEKFKQFSNDLFQAQRLVGLDLEKHTREFNEELEYYMRFIKEIRGY